MTAELHTIAPAKTTTKRPSTSKVSKAKVSKAKAGTRKESAFHARRQLALRWAANTFASTTASLMAVSLTHLAHGIQVVTGGAVWEAWALAVAIDVGILAVEAMSLIDPQRMEKVCKPYIAGVLLASAGLNVMAFTANANTTFGLWFGVVAGVALPAAYYGAGRILAKAYRM